MPERPPLFSHDARAIVQLTLGTTMAWSVNTLPQFDTAERIGFSGTAAFFALRGLANAIEAGKRISSERKEYKAKKAEYLSECSDWLD